MSFIFEQQQWKIQKESKGNKNIFIFLILNIRKTRLYLFVKHKFLLI